MSSQRTKLPIAKVWLHPVGDKKELSRGGDVLSTGSPLRYFQLQTIVVDVHMSQARAHLVTTRNVCMATSFFPPANDQYRL